MTLGSAVLKEIKGKIAGLEDKERGFRSELEAYESRLKLHAREKEECYVDLAVKYLPDMDAASVRSTLQELRGGVERVFALKQARRKEVEIGIENAQQRIHTLEEKLGRIDSELDAKVGERDRIVKQVAMELEGHKEYQVLMADAQSRKEKIDLNRKRVKQVEKDFEKKSQAYAENKLFMYLINKDYDQKGEGFIARCDGRIARLVNFDKNKRNYDFIRTMPYHMQSEVDRRQQDLENILGKMRDIQDSFEERNHLSGVLADGQKIAAERDLAMSEIQAVQSKYDDLTGERERLDNEKGEYHTRAIQGIKSYLKGASISELKRMASDTPDENDDMLVARIEELDGGIRNLKDLSIAARNTRDEIAGKIKTLHKLKDDFIRKDYESSRSRFNDDIDIDDLLTGLIIGRYTQDHVWEEIDSSQYFKPAPTYQSPTTSPRSGGSEDGGFGGGGFSGGGGFGGGGFSTGGGF